MMVAGKTYVHVENGVMEKIRVDEVVSVKGDVTVILGMLSSAGAPVQFGQWRITDEVPWVIVE